MTLLSRLSSSYRVARKRLAIRTLLACTSPYGLAAVGGLLGYRIVEGISSPAELLAAGALGALAPLLWAWGVLLRDQYQARR